MKKNYVQMLTTRFSYFPETFLLGQSKIKVIQIVRTQTSHKELAFEVRGDDGREYQLIERLNDHT